MSDHLSLMQNHVPKHEFFIAIDSDGCAFDTMEIKHKECFIPNIIKYWDLQAVSKYARAAAEFVNLYSKWRGINRFPALIMVFDLLKEWDKVIERHVKIPEAPNLRAWCKAETKLGNPALKAYCETHNEPDMHQSLHWSKAVNESVADIVKGVPPFPCVRESLQKASQAADILVCSATPGEALMREWQEHSIDQYAFAIAGQEVGSKAEHIAISASRKYSTDKMLMIGDALSDLKAAKTNKALFFPINPGDEEDSWKLFYEEALDRFIAGEYAGEYEAALIKRFETYLPEVPPWKKH